GFTTNKQALVSQIERITAESSTPIADAITEGAAYMRSTVGSGAIVLLTDGEETCGGDPEEAAAQARAQGVDVINIVGFQLDQAAQQQMTRVAAAGGGRYYDAADAAQLQTALRQAYQEAGGGGPACCGVGAALLAVLGFVFTRN
ncbi:MAG: VWA domain-containing protein, partial [Candidatus Micrarchaeia archaeon]